MPCSMQLTKTMQNQTTTFALIQVHVAINTLFPAAKHVIPDLHHIQLLFEGVFGALSDSFYNKLFQQLLGRFDLGCKGVQGIVKLQAHFPRFFESLGSALDATCTEFNQFKGMFSLKLGRNLLMVSVMLYMLSNLFHIN